MTTPTRVTPAHRLDERAKLDRRLELVPDTPPERGDRGRLAAAALLLVLLLIGAGILLLATRGSDTEDQRDAAAGQVLDLAAQIQAECNAGRLAGAICQQADAAAADPIPGPPGLMGPAGPAGPGPTPAQIQAAVTAELAANPPPAGRPPTAAEVAAAAAEYLTSNPPTPGRPPTAAEIGDAVTSYFAANPAPPGRAPTPEEIRAAVAAELAANPPPAGPPGAQGVGVSDIRAEDRDDGCVLVFVLVDPADGSTTERAVPVSSRVCDEPGLLG